jgi:hypothetical protein
MEPIRALFPFSFFKALLKTDVDLSHGNPYEGLTSMSDLLISLSSCL